MLPVDALLLRLADPSARTGLLGSAALLEVALACYDIDPASVVGDTTAVFDTVDLAVPVNPQASVTGRWWRAADPEGTQAWATVAGLVPATPAADAVWAGSVVLRTAGGDGVITDAAVTDDGHAGTGQDNLAVELTFSPVPTVTQQSAPLVLPVVVAFLVGAADASPRQLLQATALARRAAERYVAPGVPAGAPARTHERCVCWLLPVTAFDDDGWPGAGVGPPPQQRTARIAAARAWLRSQAIALVPVG